MLKIIKFTILINICLSCMANAQTDKFQVWVKDFKDKAIKSGISKNVVEDVLSDVKFLPKVIEYDRYQPEFYEDTFTYIKKRSNRKKVNEGLRLYKRERNIINQVEKKFCCCLNGMKKFW